VRTRRWRMLGPIWTRAASSNMGCSPAPAAPLCRGVPALCGWEGGERIRVVVLKGGMKTPAMVWCTFQQEDGVFVRVHFNGTPGCVIGCGCCGNCAQHEDCSCHQYPKNIYIIRRSSKHSFTTTQVADLFLKHTLYCAFFNI
jgi:hypothetical protein